MVKKLRANWKLIAATSLAFLIASIPLTWVSTSFRSLDGWTSVVVVGLLSLGILWVGWRLIQAESPPTWLSQLMAIAMILHLIVGVFWIAGLPRYGHGTVAEHEGYVMADAYARDTVAWRLARTSAPLWTAFVGNRKVDQYGGLLFLSAAVYRYLGTSFHQPLLMLLLVAAFSALSVPFTWAFARLAWGPGEARLAAWIMVVYPEAVLLGSSQMREAFTATLVVASFYGLLRYQRDHTWRALLWILVPLLLCLPFSPPAATMMLGGLVLVTLMVRLWGKPKRIPSRLLWIGLAVLVVLVSVGLYLSLRQFVPARIVNPIEMLAWWLTKSARFQAYLNAHTSGWIQKVFDEYPTGLQLPVLLAYGIVQPFLPAALIAHTEAPIWYGIAIWRALGWTFMLAFLIYAPLLALQKREQRALNLGLCLVVWIVILVAAYRGGADLWDNPRYRVMFAGLQAGLVAWTIVEHRRAADPWMRRALIATGSVLIWFLPWYLRRYTIMGWPVVDLFRTFGMGLVTAFLLILWDWARTARVPEETEAPPAEEFPPAAPTRLGVAPAGDAGPRPDVLP